MKQNNMKHSLIAVTGGIGSGKSTVLSIIKNMGYQTVSCDEITSLLYENQKILKKLKRAFPTAVSGEKTPIANKQIIANECFSDAKKYKTLSDILTKPTYKLALKQAKKLKGTVFVEVPLLFEYGYQNDFKNAIVILRKKEIRVQSVMERSNLSEQEIFSRIEKQFDYDSADLSEFYTIKNDGDIPSLIDKIKQIIEKIVSD